MTYDGDRLYELLPEIYRVRDAEQGGPLRELLQVLGDQAILVEDDIAQSYEDQFVETCAPWVVPYIGALIGLKGAAGTGGTGLTPRAEVANTVGYRRRKGTATVLEQLARDVTGWPARAVEFFELLTTTQYLNHIRPQNRTVDLRDAARMEWVDTPFERLRGQADLPHFADVRHVASGRGRYNIPHVGIFLWRLRAYSLTRSPAVPAVPGDARRFHFHPLGLDTPLFIRPETERQVSHLAEPLNVPMPISRRMLARDAGGLRGLDDYYGPGRSFVIELWTGNPADAPVRVPSEQIEVCCLADVLDGGGTVIDWAPGPPDHIAVDPQLGRIRFPADAAGEVLVSFHYGAGGDIGGGEYSRVTSFDPLAALVVRVARLRPAEFGTIPAALAELKVRMDALGVKQGSVEILDSSRYEEALEIDATGYEIEVRAADHARPTVVLTTTLDVRGGKPDRVTLNGLLIAGAGIHVRDGLERFDLRHCTLVPGVAPGSLQADDADADIRIERSILGPVRSAATARVRIVDSIVDAGGETAVAYSGLADDGPGAVLRVEESTLVGKVSAAAIELASNTLFVASRAPGDDPAAWPAPILAQRRQEGCVRFCYVPLGARVPRRYHCVPSDAGRAAAEHPIFTSLRPGDAAYARLDGRTPAAIRRGADDEGEIGAFHYLHDPQREEYLRRRLEEYLRFGLEAGVFFVS